MKFFEGGTFSTSSQQRISYMHLSPRLIDQFDNIFFCILIEIFCSLLGAADNGFFTVETNGLKSV
ncbi:hypothetical protein EG68_10719 [Paragonimus skrjabini miyazakii]|uniref:Uncharacterized protein n=1 Tax=Paragonimus skrjabini miyazakii TaxID=59628 RepID=A0A8S9YGW0_9TREM|nr:hypothetical protein EG68_10719 [Paragonimus skrjabini miyazakii]